MKEEIKEILDNLKKYIDNEETGEVIESKHTMNLLLDYINNLQERIDRIDKVNCKLRKENENLKIELNVVRKDYKQFMKRTTKYEDYILQENQVYKSRIDKAVDITNRTIEKIKQQPNGNDEWILGKLNSINNCLGGNEE